MNIYIHMCAYTHTHTHSHTGTRAGGIPDLIDEREEKQTGYLVPPGDTDTISKCVNEIAANQDKMREMGARGRIEAERYFSPLYIYMYTYVYIHIYIYMFIDSYAYM